MRLALVGALLGVVVAASSVWAAGTMSPQQIVDDRVAGMKSLIGHLKAAQAATEVATKQAELAQGVAFARSIPSKFPKGTGVGDAGVTKTRALADIWTKPEEFKAAAEALAAALESASVGAGDAGKFDAAFGDVKKSCGGCHEKFRGKEMP